MDSNQKSSPRGYSGSSGSIGGSASPAAPSRRTSSTRPSRGHARKSPNTVLLLDEIDKAEPDLPNDLLEPLDRRRFAVPNGPGIEADPNLKMLVIITTNGERELPLAFLRRCVSLVLEDPDDDRLQEIACKHYPRGDGDLHLAVALKVLEQRDRARQLDRRPPGTSEYLDALRACADLHITPQHRVWCQLAQATLVKDEPGDAERPNP
jgi:MoxR-like ATPase